MLTDKWKLTIFILIIASITFSALEEVDRTEGQTENHNRKEQADYYMENFTTLTMNQIGQPKHELKAEYMVHYEVTNRSELRQPKLRLLREARTPVHVRSDQGLIFSDKDKIILRGNVYLYDSDTQGKPKLELFTDKATLWPDKEYAETEKPAKVINGRATTTSIGLHAYLKEQRLEFLNNVRTTIKPKTTIND